MKLYDLKRGTKFELIDTEVQVPPDALEANVRGVYTYTHVDGMYAPVTDQFGNRTYFAAWTEVKPIEVPNV